MGAVEQCSWLGRIASDRQVVRDRRSLAAKRAFDLIATTLALPVLLPVLAIAALLIKLESPRDPVLFSQMRTGQGGRQFRLYKFRTMVPDAERLKTELTHLNEGQWPDFQICRDPRLTRVGRFLRKTSLDELPQIWNVYRGEMSLVGPRPNSWGPETYQLWQTERLDVQPGLTGLAQLIGRKAARFDDRVRLDIAYRQRQCLWLDLQIILRTVPAVLFGRGAH
ncbi:MAG: sugar transferase [Chloroflexi bacterium]|nr:sugar transferase [Chloroflexota bacterium]